jgi:hypothetical protein
MITTRLFLRSPKDEKSAIYFEARKGDEKIRLSTEITIPLSPSAITRAT